MHVQVDEGRIYVGGSVAEVCGVRCNNLAMWDAQFGWRALGGGVLGGAVEALIVVGSDVYVGGSFVQAGGKAAGKVARWDGRAWHSMGSVAGSVHALAAFGEDLFAGGEFLAAGGRPVSYLARFYSGEWVPVGGGVNGPVLSLQSLNGCVWMGGAFTEVRQRVGGLAVAAPYVARWCVAAQEFEPVMAPDSVLGPIRTIEPALHTVHAESCPVQAACPAAVGGGPGLGATGN